MEILKENLHVPADGVQNCKRKNMICKQKISVYGIKQSPRQWYKCFYYFIRGKKYHYDVCVYYNKLPSGEYIYLLLYVDDMLIASKSRYAIDKLKNDLSSEFEMKD